MREISADLVTEWRLQTMVIPSEGESVKWVLILDNVGAWVSQEALDFLRVRLNARAKELGAEGAMVFSETVQLV